MTARASVRLTGGIDVALPSPEAFALFTPEGERSWAHGWNPEYPGLIGVRCLPAATGTKVTVSYELTALTAQADAGLRRFAAGYQEYLAHWERAIAAVTG